MLWTVEKAVPSIQGMTNSEILKSKCSQMVCEDTEIEPQLQPLTGENMSLQSAIIEEVNVKARRFYSKAIVLFFDI